MTDHLCIRAPADTDRSVTVADRIPRGARASRKRNGVANGLNTRITTDWATGVISRSRNRWKYVYVNGLCVTTSNDVLNMPGRARLGTSLFVLSHCSN
ncbi:hypothetical protein ALC57_09296 [Trachymyrmex cornetzi]|uniref:Uncharacterized protein n=1 Tax=Trachymyrmex cornetzi TaxID=471704 RepID=A0A151J5N0_9HYME|nr:hypothetical protein ALC57_09296 [Trachymyrmex cornetzi]